MKSLPNQLTIARVVAIPLMVFFYLLGNNWGQFIAASLFVAAGITDWLDGYLARKYDQTTPLGAFLDPVADKLLVVTALVIVLLAKETGEWAFSSRVMLVAVLFIIGREITISALREWMAELGKRTTVKVGWLGKIKTTMQIIAISVLMYATSMVNGIWWYRLGEVLLIAAATLTLWSMIQYLRAAWVDIRKK